MDSGVAAKALSTLQMPMPHLGQGYTGQKAGDNQHAPRELSIPHPDVSAQLGGQMLFSCHNFPWKGHKRDGFFFTARDCGQEIPKES